MEVSLLAGDESFTIPHRLQTRCVSGDILQYVAADCGRRSRSKRWQSKLATAYGYQGDYTASYIQHLYVLRNLCAHHGWLYDHFWHYCFDALPEWKGLAVPKMGEIPQNPVFDAKARAVIPDDPATSSFWV